MVQLNIYHKVSIIAFISILIFSLFDNRIKVSGDNIDLFAYKDFKKTYDINYTNPLKFFFYPDIDTEVILRNNSIKLEHNNNRIVISGSGLPGKYIFRIKFKNKQFVRNINFNENREDSDNDGFYDLVELDNQEDRESFVGWFTSIAKSQFYKMNEGWDIIHRDCSGLITYSYKEALKKHDLNWLKGYSFLEEQRDVEKYNYPDVPILGENCFNTASGFKPGANASALLNYNMNFIGKNTADFKKGDILFYYDDTYEMPYHSMIYLGEPGYVVYHTGPIDESNSGEVRMVLLTDLLKHPDQKWHPKEYNKKFLGGFRWHILM